MLRSLTFAVLLLLIIPTATVAVTSAGAVGGAMSYLPGTGERSDPFMVSSADDLRTISDMHHHYEGAYYKQTRDIIFDDCVIGGDKITMDVSTKGNDIIVTLTIHTSDAVKNASAYVSFNDSVAHVNWTNRFNNAYFSVDELKDTNTIVAAGSINDKHFATGMNFFPNDGERSISASFEGNFTPIGSKEFPFSGFYDGNGYSITGIKVASAGQGEQCAGLFGYTDEATVFNVRILSKQENESYFLTNAVDKLRSEDGSSESFSGSMIGHGTASSSIMFCHNEAIVSSVSEVGGSPDTVRGGEEPIMMSCIFSYVGGLTGFGTGTIFHGENTGNVISIAVSDTVLDTNVRKDVQTIIVHLYAYSFLGGLIGYSDGSEISLSGNFGNVFMINGIHAEEHSHFTDDVSVNLSGTFVSAVGGTAGMLEGKISDVHNAGQISFGSAMYGNINDLTEFTNILIRFNTSVGGICGIMGGTSVAERVCASGNMTIFEISPMHTDIIRIESAERHTGKITGTVSGNSVSIENCYYRSDMKNYPVIGSGGIGFEARPFNLTESDEIMFDLDFNRTWSISDTGHPLIWVRYDMTIIDVSESFDGSAKYSVDHEYFFDGEGTLFSYIDKDGFSLRFANGYGDGITIYMLIDGEKITLKQDGNNHYMMPSEYLMGASSGITLYIDGFAKVSPNQELGFAASVIISVLTAFVMAASVYNAKFASSMLRIYDTASGDEGNDEQT